ncbi:unnamed protein product [Pleuronectes platessa]|uniref:Hepcidin n=1 Tax=Pleuronectes platessa TaxID=8262 RepID=A0A9N7W2P0_PLEPL|nr:unnamed protein product [Pleuronectes platessa]
MKTCGFAVAVVVLLTFICNQEGCSVSVTEDQVLQDSMGNGEPQEVPAESSGRQWMMPFHLRQRRHSGPMPCRCCECCPEPPAFDLYHVKK